LSKLKIHLDLAVVLKEFFELKDWKQRSLYLGGIYTLISAIFWGYYVMGSMLMAIPILGIFLFFIPIGLIAIFMMAFYVYLVGYRLDVAEAYRSGNSIEEVDYMGNYSVRLKKGVILGSAQFVYSLPIIIFLVIGYAGLLFSVVSIQETPYYGSESLAFFGMLFSVLILCLGAVLQMAIQLLIVPILHANFLKYNDFSKLFDFGYMWKLIKENWLDSVLIWAIMSLLNFIIVSATYFSGFLVFLCIGLFVLPVVIAISTVYRQHVQARLVGELAKHID
jgi:hypothetical protein